jgi:hypothetical protein
VDVLRRLDLVEIGHRRQRDFLALVGPQRQVLQLGDRFILLLVQRQPHFALAVFGAESLHPAPAKRQPHHLGRLHG